MSTMRRERGFGLVAAMFLIIVIAMVIAAMARLSSSASGSVTLGIQQARAYQSARVGMEWGIAQAVKGASCGGASTLNGFSITVACNLSGAVAIDEESRSVQFYRITATAEFGAVGSPDYAYRRLTSVVEKP